MRTKFFGLLISAFAVVVFIPAVTTGQFQFKGKGGGGGMSSDPEKMFDYLSRGRGYFEIKDTTRLREPLTQFAQERGITNGQITKQQFIEFNTQMNAKISAAGSGKGSNPVPFQGGGGDFGKKRFGGDGGPSINPKEAVNNPDMLNQLAESDFKRRDNNGDGRLNKDEMPDSLRRNLMRWDRNGDGLIELSEFREYYVARLSGDEEAGGNNSTKGIASIIIEENELDLKPTVLRAGKLPKNMPAWFKELDTDNDGQVALFEWRTGRKNIDEFKNWDLNDDGFITPEEALRTQDVLAKNGSSSSGTFGMSMAREGQGGERPRFEKGQFPFGPGSGGDNPFGKKGNGNGGGGNDFWSKMKKKGGN